MQTIELTVYGTTELCPSCVGLPSAQETASWLSAAFARKYGSQVAVKYVDFQAPVTTEEKAWADQIVEQDLWYPVVVLEGKVVAEGNPKLKEISQLLEQKYAVSPLN